MVENGSIVEFIKKKNYEMINNNLGSGSFGKTVLLKDPFIDELFVAKKYEPDFDDIDEQKAFYDSFLQEIKIMYKLNHRNVVRIYNYYAYEEMYTGYILMEYIDGMNISEYFNNYLPWEDKASPDDIFVQLIDGFLYIESQGIIHRDIREGNIMIDKNGVAKIIDFGLGKSFKPVVDTSTDSLRDIINRSGLDCLPNEFFEGRYTSKTDMFYLAELFNRMLRDYCLSNSFSYEHILKKMMDQNEENRYLSFAEIKDALEKKKFSVMSISAEDKKVYQEFADGLFCSLACYTSNEKEYVNSISEFLERLKNVIIKNCFEAIVQNNSDVIRTILKSGFKYYQNINITYDTVKSFYNWIIELPEEAQMIVINNLKSKISGIKVEIEEDLPF